MTNEGYTVRILGLPEDERRDLLSALTEHRAATGR